MGVIGSAQPQGLPRVGRVLAAEGVRNDAVVGDEQPIHVLSPAARVRDFSQGLRAVDVDAAPDPSLVTPPLGARAAAP